MKILFFSHESTYHGGGSQALFEIVKKFKEDYGVECIVITPKIGLLNEKLSEIGVLNYNFSYFWCIKKPEDGKLKNTIRYIRYILYREYAIYKINKTIDMESIDLIYTNTSVIDIGAHIALKHKIAHVWHIRELIEEHFGFRAFYDNYPRYIDKSSNRIIVISKAVMKKYIDKGINENKIDLVYDGIDIDLYSSVPIKVADKNKLNCVFVGHIDSLKGQFDVVKAIANLSENLRSKIIVDFYGNYDKKYYLDIKRFIKMNNLSRNFRFLGFTYKINELLNKYDIGFVCSKFESFGRITAEYMLSQVCPIVSNTGANVELVDDGYNGVLYKYGDVNHLASKIEYLEANRDYIIKLSKEARVKALSNYSLNKNVYQLYTIFEACQNKD